MKKKTLFEKIPVRKEKKGQRKYIKLSDTRKTLHNKKKDNEVKELMGDTDNRIYSSEDGGR